METIGKRLKYFLSQEGVTVSEFSVKTGIPEPSIYRIINSESSGLNSTTIIKILEIYPNLDVNWLITGIGTYKNELGRDFVAEDRISYGNEDVLKKRVKEILSNEVILETFVEILKKYDK